MAAGKVSGSWAMVSIPRGPETAENLIEHGTVPALEGQ